MINVHPKPLIVVKLARNAQQRRKYQKTALRLTRQAEE